MMKVPVARSTIDTRGEHDRYQVIEACFFLNEHEKHTKDNATLVVCVFVIKKSAEDYGF
jgi:hypothetical protein